MITDNQRPKGTVHSREMKEKDIKAKKEKKKQQKQQKAKNKKDQDTKKKATVNPKHLHSVFKTHSDTLGLQYLYV